MRVLLYLRVYQARLKAEAAKLTQSLFHPFAAPSIRPSRGTPHI
ncbi:MAG: hypothetical protein WDO73_29135 [Ignavibacteriota bacterium]